MTKIQNSKRYDLEERTAQFAEKCRDFVKKLPKTTANREKQYLLEEAVELRKIFSSILDKSL